MIDPTINAQNWQPLVMAIGGLGTAAYGVVDATKALGGGVSCDLPVPQPPGEARAFGPLPLIVPADNSAELPEGALVSPQGPEFANWRQAWAAGFASSRF